MGAGFFKIVRPKNSFGAGIPEGAFLSLYILWGPGGPYPPKRAVPPARHWFSTVLLWKLLLIQGWLTPLALLGHTAMPSSPLLRMLQFMTVEFEVPWQKFTPSA